MKHKIEIYNKEDNKPNKQQDQQTDNQQPLSCFVNIKNLAITYKNKLTKKHKKRKLHQQIIFSIENKMILYILTF